MARLRAAAAPLLAGLLAAGAGGAAESQRDPLDSGVWADLVATELGGGPAVYGGGLHLAMPDAVEDPFSVPGAIELTRGFGEVAEIALLAENNPIRTAVRIVPHRYLRAVGFDIRLEGSGPVRAAALAGDPEFFFDLADGRSRVRVAAEDNAGASFEESLGLGPTS